MKEIIGDPADSENFRVGLDLQYANRSSIEGKSLMPDEKAETGEQKLKKDSKKPVEEKYVLRLYVAGTDRKSSKAIANLRRVCEEHLAGRYELKIIDIKEKGTLARDEQIVAVPVLIKQIPEPLRKLIGDMSDKDKVLLGMDLQPKKKD